ncbi:MAG: hypothetical protein JST87_08015 [Bacteroidetes bacterium]|nr:hypothetical protein [Bacteroidota bacterium]MBS1935790.1 hypothetical protein [Bacteroidota bacterium]
MNSIRRIAGILWIAIAPVALYYLIKTGMSEIEKKPTIDTKIQWIVFIIVFIPAAIGLVIFGYYALKGEYDEN